MSSPTTVLCRLFFLLVEVEQTADDVGEIVAQLIEASRSVEEQWWVLSCTVEIPALPDTFEIVVDVAFQHFLVQLAVPFCQCVYELLTRSLEKCVEGTDDILERQRCADVRVVLLTDSRTRMSAQAISRSTTVGVETVPQADRHIALQRCLEVVMVVLGHVAPVVVQTSQRDYPLFIRCPKKGRIPARERCSRIPNVLSLEPRFELLGHHLIDLIHEGEARTRENQKDCRHLTSSRFMCVSAAKHYKVLICSRLGTYYSAPSDCQCTSSCTACRYILSFMVEASDGFVRKEKLARHDQAGVLKERQFRSRAEVESREDGEQEVAIVEDERRVVLNEFLPGDVRFAGTKGAEFGHRNIRNPRAKSEDKMFVGQVEFPPEELNTLTGRLALLHEMAHGIKGFSSPDRPNRKMRETIDTAYKVYDSIKRSRALQEIASPEEHNSRYVEEFKKGWERENTEHQKKGFAALRYTELAKAIETLAGYERNTWVEALALHHRIKENSGVDILGGASTKEIFRVVESEALGDYERIYGPLLRLAGEKDVEGIRQSWIDRLFNRLEAWASS